MVFREITLQIDKNLIGILARAVVDCRGIFLRLGCDSAGAGKRLFINFGLTDAILKLRLRVGANTIGLRLRLSQNGVGFLLRLFDNLRRILLGIGNGILRLGDDAGCAANVFGDNNLEILQQVQQAVYLDDAFVGAAKF
ncbi:hypothetical protein SDC9_186716 [bioreactor metagenome]|uniref:Uncharacterized protein n=1 Tax=bioreactor metagenome TaxID=1076179 RepID=A0A645HJK2_9ZZZZ